MELQESGGVEANECVLEIVLYAHGPRLDSVHQSQKLGAHWRPWGEHFTGKVTVTPGVLWVEE